MNDKKLKLFKEILIKRMAGLLGIAEGTVTRMSEGDGTFPDPLDRAMTESSSEREWVNLKKCLEEHLRLAIDLLDKVYDKSIKTIHKGEDSKKEEHLNILSKLRRLKKEMLTN